MTYKGLCVFSIFALFTLLGTNQLGAIVAAGSTVVQGCCIVHAGLAVYERTRL